MASAGVPAPALAPSTRIEAAFEELRSKHRILVEESCACCCTCERVQVEGRCQRPLAAIADRECKRPMRCICTACGIIAASMLLPLLQGKLAPPKPFLIHTQRGLWQPARNMCRPSHLPAGGHVRCKAQLASQPEAIGYAFFHAQDLDMVVEGGLCSVLTLLLLRAAGSLHLTVTGEILRAGPRLLPAMCACNVETAPMICL